MRAGGYGALGRPNDDELDLELATSAEAGSRLGAYGDELEEELEGNVAPEVSLSLVYDAAPKPWVKWAAIGALGLLLLSGGRRRVL